MPNYLYRIIAVILILSNITNAKAQTELWYTSDGDLSSSLINNVLYDSRGMLWITTDDCLNRFDGSKFTIYRADCDNPSSIANDHVNGIFEDSKGRLFVCTHYGVQIYDPATDSFSPPLLVDGHNESSPLSDMVERSTGELWVVGNEIYRIVDQAQGPILEHIDLPAELRFVNQSVADNEDNIWISKGVSGVYRITPSAEVKHYLGGQGDPTPVSFAVGSDGTLYMGSAKKGLFRYDKEADEFVHIDLGYDYDTATISVIYPDDFGNILVGTDGDGMLAYHPDKATVTPFAFSNIDYNKLKIHAIENDSYGNLWVGVFQKGLLKKPRPSGFFRSIDQRTSNIIGSCCVTAILRDSDGQLWVGTDNDDVFVIPRGSQTSKHYVEKVPNSIMGMYEDSKGRLWLGSYNRGMGVIDRHTGAYTPHRIQINGHEVNHVYDFAELPDGQLLLATMGWGLIRYNPETHEAEKIEDPSLSDWVTTVDLMPGTGNIYVGTYDGLFIFKPDMSEYSWVIRKHIVSSVHLAPDHNSVWVGTNLGLVHIGKDHEVERTYTTADGLPSQSILAIEHGDDALWVSTNQGLSKFNFEQETFANFSVDNGLPNNEFSRNSSFRDADGMLYFGGINGIATFKGSVNSQPAEKLTLRVTDFIIGDTNVNASTKSGSHNIIDRPVTEATTFRLSHDDNSFSIRINTREFANAAQSDYYYSFDDAPWTEIRNIDNTMGGVLLSFNKVASGKHTLKVKMVNGGIESDELALDIEVDTVWYASWWAKLIYLMIALGIVYAVYYEIRRRITTRRQEEERRHQREILESKLQFFTNISHEIRTPLSLVIGPLQKLEKTDNDKERTNTYNMILRNANRILRLLNELLDLRKIDNNQMRLHFAKVDMVHFIDDLYGTFTPAAAARNITLSYNQPSTPLEAYVDLSHFDKVVMNLLSNALKFTPEGGKIDIDLTSGVNADVDGPLSRFVQISVTDNGIGIDVNDRKNIFDRFFQGANNNIGGTGIGLHLSSQFVKLHHGTIEVTENPEGKGTRFVIQIPAGCEHLSADEIVTAPQEVTAPEIVNDMNDEQIKELIPADESKSKVKSPRSNELVYVVEDDEDIRSYLEVNLNKYFHVRGFSNGKSALEAIHETQPALVITDVMMPEMDGYTLTKKIKQNINLNQIPVIILTAKTQEVDNLEAIDSGATVYITKPFNIDVVVRNAQNLVENMARLRNAFSGKQTQESRIEKIEVASNDDKLMDRVMKVINKNLSNSDITVEMIANEIGISRVHLHRKLKELTNQSTRDFIRNIRLQAAAKILREKKLTVAEVSDLVGFKQANNFSTAFKEMFGMSPTAYSAKHQAEKAPADA